MIYLDWIKMSLDLISCYPELCQDSHDSTRIKVIQSLNLVMRLFVYLSFFLLRFQVLAILSLQAPAYLHVPLS